MNNALVDCLSEIKKNAEQFQSEEATKQWAILPVLECVGWNPKAIGEVIPEYPVGGGKVDYCLRHSGREQCFVEAKNPGQDLQKSQEQLLKYVFQAKADLAVLTNGVTWWLYLPHEGGAWEEKRFFVVDLENQDPSSAAAHLEQFLGKAPLLSGEAVKKAKELLKGRERKRSIETALPKAWEQLLAGPDETLCTLLAETTEKMCGHKPDADEVSAFLKDSKRAEQHLPPIDRPRGRTGREESSPVIENCLKLLREIVPSAALHYPPRSKYVGTTVDGRMDNTVYFMPRQHWTMVSVKVRPRNAWVDDLATAGIQPTAAGASESRVRFRLTEADVQRHGTLLRRLFKAAYGSK